MNCTICTAQIKRDYLSCHECPDMTEPDGTLNIMPGCMGGAMDTFCTCEIEPLHTCSHCRHPRPGLIGLAWVGA